MIAKHISTRLATAAASIRTDSASKHAPSLHVKNVVHAGMLAPVPNPITLVHAAVRAYMMDKGVDAVLYFANA
jgi:hypothetical protein